jgi:hypothetical protein
VSATRISMMIWFYFLPSHCEQLQRSSLFSFLCMTGTVSEIWNHWDMNVFYSDSKTDLKLRCDYCTKFQRFKGSQDFSVDWWLCVECYYPTTPTDYPSTKRDTSVGPPVAVNIDFCGYLRFLSIRFVWIIYGHSTPLTTFLVNKECSLHRSVLIFQPTVNSSASYKQS